MFVFTRETVFSDATLGQKVCFGAGEAARFLREVVAELGAERRVARWRRGMTKCGCMFRRMLRIGPAMLRLRLPRMLW